MSQASRARRAEWLEQRRQARAGGLVYTSQTPAATRNPEPGPEPEEQPDDVGHES